MRRPASRDFPWGEIFAAEGPWRVSESRAGCFVARDTGEALDNEFSIRVIFLLLFAGTRTTPGLAPRRWRSKLRRSALSETRICLRMIRPAELPSTATSKMRFRRTGFTGFQSAAVGEFCHALAFLSSFSRSALSFRQEIPYYGILRRAKLTTLGSLSSSSSIFSLSIFLLGHFFLLFCQIEITRFEERRRLINHIEIFALRRSLLNLLFFSTTEITSRDCRQEFSKSLAFIFLSCESRFPRDKNSARKRSLATRTFF